MQKVDLETNQIEYEDTIECIHTAVCDIPVEEFEDVINDKDFEQTILQIRSSERLQEIHLDPEEKFKALKSWVAGIAEAGTDAFKLQADIDIAANLAYPIMDRLLRFIMTVDHEFIGYYLQKIEKNSWFEGSKHYGYLIASLIPILGMIARNTGDIEPENEWRYIPNQQFSYFNNYREIIDLIFLMDPPIELFTKNQKFIKFLALPEAADMSEFPKLFTHRSARVRRKVAQNPSAADFDQYRKFLDPETEKNDYVRSTALRNSAALKWLMMEEEANALIDLQNITLRYIPMVKDCRRRNGYTLNGRHIAQLNLQNMNLSYLPSSLSKLIHLNYLDLSHNQISDLKEKLTNLVNLEHLDISHNNIESPPYDLGALNKLRYLNLSYNRIYHLPEIFIDIPNLESFYINRNNLRHLPDDLFTSKNLQILDGSHNQIKFVQPSIKNLKNLKRLILQNNKIKTLPQELAEIKSLKIVNLNDNLLTQVPSFIKSGNKIEQIYLKGNKFTDRKELLKKWKGQNYQSKIESGIIYKNHRSYHDVDFIFNKIAVTGAGGCGKTSLMHRYFYGSFNPSMKITIAPEFFSEEVLIDDFYLINQFWDYAGVSRLRFIVDDNLKGTSAVLLCYDVSRFQTFKELDKWYALILKNISNPLIYLVGIKSDLTAERNISADYYSEWISNKQIDSTFECSPKSGHNVNEIFKKLKEDLITRWI